VVETLAVKFTFLRTAYDIEYTDKIKEYLRNTSSNAPTILSNVEIAFTQDVLLYVLLNLIRKNLKVIFEKM
jgi:hypothetical protein